MLKLRRLLALERSAFRAEKLGAQRFQALALPADELRTQPRLDCALGQLPVRPHEMAGVAAGIAQKIILMLGLGFPEFASRDDFGHGLAGPQARSVDVGDGVFGDPLLLLAGVEDRRSIATSHVVALAIARARVVDLEKEFEKLPIAQSLRVKDD